jgi:hypothetical protein
MGLAACLIAARAEEANTSAVPPSQAGAPQDHAKVAPADADAASPLTATTESPDPSTATAPAATTGSDKTPDPARTNSAVLRYVPAPGYSPSRSSFAVPLQRVQEAAAQKAPFSVVEMPREPQAIGGPGRPRHALSFESETTRKAMRSIGFEATSCALQFRAPAKLSSDGGSVEVKAQARLHCRY